MFKTINSLIPFFILLNTNVFAFTLPKEWRYYQEIKIEKTGLQKLSLSINALDKCKPGFEDLRIYTEDEVPVPFVLEIPKPVTINPSGTSHFDVALSDDFTEISLATGSNEQIESIILQTPEIDFLKRADVYVSQDNKNWNLIESGKVIFRQLNRAENLQINLPGFSCRNIKIKVYDKISKPIPFTDAKLMFKQRKIDVVSYAVDTQLSSHEIFNNRSRITVFLPANNLYIHHLELKIATPLFSRKVTVFTREFKDDKISEKVIGDYSVYKFTEGEYLRDENIRIVIDRQIDKRELILEFNNGDSPILEVADIKAYVFPVSLIFYANEAKPLILIFDNKEAEKLDYDLGKLDGKIKETFFYTPVIGKINENKGYEAPVKLKEFSGMAGAIDVSEWKYRKGVRPSSKPFHRVELDLEVLSKCYSDFRDLRLVSGSRQLAYVIERTELIKPIQLTIKEKKEDISDKITYITLKLPYSNIPVKQLTCKISNSLFNRDIILFEENKDQNGREYKNELARAKWVKIPGQKENTYTLFLDRIIESDKIYLAVYNQDNEPLDISGLEIFYPVVYIIFKTNLDSGIYLYYSNPKADTPRYDIGMIADEYLTAEKGDGILNKEELAGSESFFHSKVLTKKSGLLFWAVLISVVVILMAIIRKLLPGQK